MWTSDTDLEVPEVRILVVSDPGTGKSSLIHAAAYPESCDGAIPPKVPSRMPPTRFPEDMFPDRVPVIAFDVGAVDEEDNRQLGPFRRLNTSVVLVYCKSTFDRLRTFWLPLLKRINKGDSKFDDYKNVQFLLVILAGSRSELDKDSKYDDYKTEKWISMLMREFPQVEMCIEFSLGDRSQVMSIHDVFYAAQSAILHPRGPLLDPETQMLSRECVWALKRIFIMCDKDRDGALNDAELNDLQVKCFDEPIVTYFVNGTVAYNCSEGVNENGLTLRGFLMLNELCIAKGLTEVTWTVLRKFDYNNFLELSDDHIFLPIRRTPDQTVELTSEALEYLRGVYSSNDRDYVCSLIFSHLRFECYVDTSCLSEHAVESNEFGGLSLDGFLAQWAFITLLDPVFSVGSLIQLGYPDHPSSAVRVTRGRCVDRKKQQSDRNVFQCFVFGPKEAGKSSLLQSFVGRPFSETCTPTFWEYITVNTVDHPDGTRKTLILREIPNNMLLLREVAFSDCDIAVFVHDR
uniref:mitochondrial Rho GTPase 1-like n=1 Tax=Erigeron canadensis TaxID=72917 RepID=UPI001CB895FA|nr:mitochondrial Rho GTPase 1-like [Erigeron canadensis]